ncbi:MAG: hypothetical protein KIT84_13980 [Labilithrix sp.]|nr:hypothetical protein [Labilithrix sp.]
MGLLTSASSASLACGVDRCQEGPACGAAVDVAFVSPIDPKRDRLEVVVDDSRVLRCIPQPRYYRCDQGLLVDYREDQDGGTPIVSGFLLTELPPPSTLNVRVLRDDRLLGEASFRPEYRDTPAPNGEECRPCRYAEALTMTVAHEGHDGG